MTSWAVAVLRPDLLNWYGHQRLYSRLAQATGVEVFAPRYRKVYRRNGRKVVREFLLFPSYLFVASTSAHWRPVLDHFAVRDLLRTASGAVAHVSESVIAQVRAMCSGDGLWIAPQPHRFQIDQRVRVQRGHFTGLVGTFAGTRGQREEALLELLGQKVRVDFKLGDLIAA